MMREALLKECFGGRGGTWLHADAAILRSVFRMIVCGPVFRMDDPRASSPAFASAIGAARVAYGERRLAEAEAIYRNLLADVPSNREALASLADLLAEQGRFAEAEPLYRAALAI